MASNTRIKGISIEIGGNTKPLSDALKDVDKSLKDTQDQLKDVNKLLKLDPGNVELLRQKQDLLTKGIADTKKRQEELTKALEQAKNAGDTEENRKQQDALQRELIETTAKLKGMESELGSMGKETNEASAALEKGAKSASNFGDVLKAKLTGDAIIGAAKKLAGALKEVALGAAQLADDLETQSAQTGISTDALQEYAYMANLVDVDVSTVTGSMTKLTKSMNSASKGSGDAYDAFKRLGVSVTDINGELRDNEDVFNDLVDALGGVKNETERDALAMQIFGKSAQDLNPLIKAGSKQLKAYAKEAHDVGYVMDKDVIKKNVEASDAMERLKKAGEATKNAIGSALAPAITKTATAMQKMAKWVQENLKTLKNVATVVGIAAAAFVAYKAIVAAIELPMKIATAAQALLNSTMMANPIVAVIAAMAALFITLDKFSKKTYEIGDDVKAVKEEMAAFKEEVDEVVSSADAMNASVDRQIQGAEAEFAYYGQLADELDGIVDANGKVKEGYEGRAEVITGILAEALGIEIDLTNGVIQNYETLKNSLDEVITKKKAELVLKAQEELYTEALKTRQTATMKLMEAERQRTEKAQMLSKKQDELTSMELERQNLERNGLNDYTKYYYEDLLYRIEAKQKEVAEMQTATDDAGTAYDDLKRTVDDATYNIGVYEQNLQAVTRGEYDKIITANAEVARSYNDLDAEGKAAMDSLTNDTAKLGANLYSDTKQAGEDFINGFIKGIENRKPSLKQTVANVGVSGKQWLKDSLDEHSPSKATMEMGEFFVAGLRLGIESEQRGLLQQIANFGRSTLAAFANATGDGFSIAAPLQMPTMSTNAGALLASSQTPGGVNVSVVVNGNVDNYDVLAETIGQKLQQQMAREGRAFA